MPNVQTSWVESLPMIWMHLILVGVIVYQCWAIIKINQGHKELWKNYNALVTKIMAYSAYKENGVGGAHSILAVDKLQGIANESLAPQKRQEKPKEEIPPKKFTVIHGLGNGIT